MPTVVDRKLKTRNTYPWEKWLLASKGKPCLYKQGEDFEVSIENFVSNAYGFALRNNYTCVTNRAESGKGVYLHFVPKNGKKGHHPLKPGRPVGGSKAAAHTSNGSATLTEDQKAVKRRQAASKGGAAKASKLRKKSAKAKKRPTKKASPISTPTTSTTIRATL